MFHVLLFFSGFCYFSTRTNLLDPDDQILFVFCIPINDDELNVVPEFRRRKITTPKKIPDDFLELRRHISRHHLNF